MPTNLRAFPMQGYVADSAGNVIRNASIEIKESTPNNGSITIDAVVSDDGGYFITKPLKNGVYDIYESGIRVSRSIHNTSSSNIQCYFASSENIPNNLPQYDSLGLGVSDEDINKFRYYIQIENNDVDIKNYGHLFPIDDNTSTIDPNFVLFHNMGLDARITTTRFDIEFFTQSPMRRMRWAGIPAIKFHESSKLVLPLDFYSIVANRPVSITTCSDVVSNAIGTEAIEIYSSSSEDTFIDIIDSAVKGDIFKLTSGADYYYGIYIMPGSYGPASLQSMKMKLLRNSRYPSATSTFETSAPISSITKYDGFFNGLMNITTSVSEKFTVVENVYAQDLDEEMYNYSNQ